ncbi:unnamed protein product, partial [Timema podura]|nr:unnamed protein product [Timema podura]
VDFYLPNSGNETQWEMGSNESIDTQLLPLKEEFSSVNEDLDNLEMESDTKLPTLNDELPSIKEDLENLEMERNEATDKKFLALKDEFTPLKEDKYLKINTNASHGHETISNEIFGLDTFGINPNTYCKTINDSNFQTVYIPTVLQNNSNKAQGCTNTFTKSSCLNNSLRGSNIKKHEDDYAKCKEINYSKPAKEDGYCLGGFCKEHEGVDNKCKEIKCSKTPLNSGFCKKHGETYPKCKVINCSKAALKGGHCKEHREYRKCKEKNCNKYPLKFGYCKDHGGVYTKCKEINCSKFSRACGYCGEHGGTYNNYCNEVNCSKLALKGGYCGKHGGVTSRSVWQNKILQGITNGLTGDPTPRYPGLER